MVSQIELPSYQSFYHYITTQTWWESRWQCVLKVTRTSSILVKESANLLSFQTTQGCWWSIWFEMKMMIVTINFSDTSCQLEGKSSLCAGGGDTFLSLNPVTPGFESATHLSTHHTSDDLSNLIPVQSPVSELSCYPSQAAFPSVNSHGATRTGFCIWAFSTLSAVQKCWPCQNYYFNFPWHKTVNR